MHSTDAVRLAQARLIVLLEQHGDQTAGRIVALLSSAADHLLDSTALPDLASLGAGAGAPTDPRVEIADIAANLRDVLPLMGDRAAIAIGFALRDLSAAQALWRRS
jgi:hypothetical protein